GCCLTRFIAASRRRRGEQRGDQCRRSNGKSQPEHGSMVVHKSGAEQRFNVLDALLVALLEADLGEKLAALQVVQGDGIVVDLGDEWNVGRIFVSRVAEVQQVVLYGDDLAAGGGGEKDHVVRACSGLDVRSRGNQFRQARELI